MKKLNKQIKVSLLSVIAFLLMFIELSVPLFPTFLKIDISDLPALLGTFALGPAAGVLIELFKNILHGLFCGSTVFVGELANFVGGSILVIIAGTIYKNNKNKKNAIIGLTAGTLIMSLTAGILNMYVYLPLYEKILHIPIDAVVGMSRAVNPKVVDLNTLIVWAIIPFNIFKGIVVSGVTAVVYKSVSPILHTEEILETKKAEN